MAGSGRVGFIGLGNMGGPMSGHALKACPDLIVYDAAGTAERAPQGAAIAGSTPELAAAAETVLLCLPKGTHVASVAEEIVRSNARRTRRVVDMSTIGLVAAKEAHGLLAKAGIDYCDAPISGGVSGARAGTVAIMFSGSEAALGEVRPVLDAIGKVFHVGDRPGQGQAMKLLNNFLSATAMAATAEALAFGERLGLEMGLMLDVLNASSGRNTATEDKYPKRVLTGSYDAGFTNTLLDKDVTLYQDNVLATGTPNEIGAAVGAIWRRFNEAAPGGDITRIYPFLRDGG